MAYKTITEDDAIELYENMLRECYGETVNIAGLDYDICDALKSLDPTAYRCGMVDYLDSCELEIE